MRASVSRRIRGTTPAVPIPQQSTSSSGESEIQAFALERYRYILNQIHTVNENVYRFLAIYQAIATASITAALGLFVGYKGWGIKPSVARTGVFGLIALETGAAAFTMLLIFIGVLAWLDYRREECELTDEIVGKGFRSQPKLRNFFRWYETYILMFIAASTAFVWIFALAFVMPNMK